MTRTRSISIAIIFIVVAAACVAFTTPGHRVLASLGFATADCTGQNC
jgi:hypothetical protein